MTRELDNVIHVRFGPGGGRQAQPRPAPPPQEPARESGRALDRAQAREQTHPQTHPQTYPQTHPQEEEEPLEVPTRRADPMGDLYGRDEVARLFDLSEGKLRYWDRVGFLRPSGDSGAKRLYTFQDLIQVRAAKGLLDSGVPFREVRRSVEALRRTLPHIARPLGALRVTAEGHSVVVRDHGPASFEPATGQLVLDFEVSALRDAVVEVLRPQAFDPERQRRAYELYLEGCRLDEDESLFERAEELYRKALALDPSLANAWTNLGNLRYRAGEVEEAVDFYEQALSIDPKQPEAYYNLGFLCFDQAAHEEAIVYFREALKAAPAFADAHFNLAMALTEVGRPEEAQPHWRTYLKLDTDGPWAEIARRHLSPNLIR